jgi:hypothetical protein
MRHGSSRTSLHCRGGRRTASSNKPPHSAPPFPRRTDRGHHLQTPGELGPRAPRVRAAQWTHTRANRHPGAHGLSGRLPAATWLSDPRATAPFTCSLTTPSIGCGSASSPTRTRYMVVRCKLSRVESRSDELTSAAIWPDNGAIWLHRRDGAQLSFEMSNRPRPIRRHGLIARSWASPRGRYRTSSTR